MGTENSAGKNWKRDDICPDSCTKMWTWIRHIHVFQVKINPHVSQKHKIIKLKFTSWYMRQKRKWVSKFGSNYTMLKDRGSNQSYKPITNTAWVRTQKMGALNSHPQVVKFTSCLPSVCGSLQLPPPPNWSPRYSWNIAESGAKHQKFQILLIHISIISVFSRTFDIEFHSMKTNGMKPWGKN